jgi:hypothetical protein
LAVLEIIDPAGACDEGAGAFCDDVRIVLRVLGLMTRSKPKLNKAGTSKTRCQRIQDLVQHLAWVPGIGVA